MAHRSPRLERYPTRHDTENITAGYGANQFRPGRSNAQGFGGSKTTDCGENRGRQKPNHLQGIGGAEGRFIAVHNDLLTAKAVPDCKKQRKNP